MSGLSLDLPGDGAEHPTSGAAGALPRAEVLARLRERIFAFAASRMERAQAEDLVQEVLLVIHTKYAHLEALEDLVPLSFQILRFKMAAHWRKAARHGEAQQVDVTELPLPGPDPDPHAAAERRELLGRLTEGLASLGPRCRELFRLKLLGKGFAEIQEILGAATLNTVYTWDHRCRKELLARLGGHWDGRRAP